MHILTLVDGVYTVHEEVAGDELNAVRRAGGAADRQRLVWP